jgi:hypothetical protein
LQRRATPRCAALRCAALRWVVILRSTMRYAEHYFEILNFREILNWVANNSKRIRECNEMDKLLWRSTESTYSLTFS